MPHVTPDKILALVLPQFGFTLEDCKISRLGNGLINNTFLVQSADQKFVLQCLNQQVFKTPQQVTDNAYIIFRNATL